MKRSSSPVIFTCIDKNLVPYLDHLYNSIKKYTKKFKFYVLCDKDISREDMKEYNFNIIYDIDIPEIDTFRLSGTSKIRSKAMYYRFKAPYILPYEKLIYVDNDVIFNASIEELWDVKLGTKLLAATKDQFNDGSVDTVVNLQYNGNVKIKYTSEIFASGILVMNAKRWKQEDILEDMITLYEDYPMLDMLMMNLICRDRIKTINANWCVPANYVGNDLVCVSTLKKYKPKCWHWHGPKPWDKYGALRNQVIYEDFL